MRSSHTCIPSTEFGKSDVRYARAAPGADVLAACLYKRLAEVDLLALHTVAKKHMIYLLLRASAGENIFRDN